MTNKQKYKGALELIAELTQERRVIAEDYCEMRRSLRTQEHAMKAVQLQLSKSVGSNNELRKDNAAYQEVNKGLIEEMNKVNILNAELMKDNASKEYKDLEVSI